MSEQDNTMLWIGLAVLALILVSGAGWWLAGAMWTLWWGVLIFLLPFLLVAALVIGVGYLAYRARVAREEAPLEEMIQGPDPVDELSRINDELEDLGKEAAASLERTRDTMERGLRG